MPTGGRRGAIRGLSYGSRRRLIKSLMHVDFASAHAVFATLTYHNGFTRDFYQWSEHLHTFTVLLQRKWASYCPSGHWRKEFQKRGAPHFHLVLYFRQPVPVQQLRAWIASTWNAVAEPGDDVALRVGTSCDLVRLDEKGGVGKLMRYLVKYVGKDDQSRLIDLETGEVLQTGRMWGTFGEVPSSVVAMFTLDYDGKVKYARRIRNLFKRSRYCKRVGKSLSSALLFGSPQTFLQLLRGIVPDSELVAAGYSPPEDR